MEAPVKFKSTGRWYSPETGAIVPDVTGANGFLRPPTVADARKNGWVPSVTTILKIVANPGLEKWKNEQFGLSVLTLPRLPGESETAFLERAYDDSQREGIEAADIGTQIHNVCEQWIKSRTETTNIALLPYQKAFMQWLETNLSPEKSRIFAAETQIVGSKFAGTIDLIIATNTDIHILDIKSQNVKVEEQKKGLKKKPAFYDEWLWQLSLYRDLLHNSERIRDILEKIGNGQFVHLHSLIIDRNLNDAGKSEVFHKEWTEDEMVSGRDIAMNIVDLFRMIKKL